MEYQIKAFFGRVELEQEYRPTPDGIACFSRKKEVAPDGTVTYTEWQDLGSRILNCSWEQFQAYQRGDFNWQPPSRWRRLKAWLSSLIP